MEEKVQLLIIGADLVEICILSAKKSEYDRFTHLIWSVRVVSIELVVPWSATLVFPAAEATVLLASCTGALKYRRNDRSYLPSTILVGKVIQR